MKHQLSRETYKIPRILLFLLSAVMLLSASSCEFDKDVTENTTTKNTTTLKTTATTADDKTEPEYEYPAYIIREDEGYIKDGFIETRVTGLTIDEDSFFNIAYKVQEFVNCDDEYVTLELFYGTILREGTGISNINIAFAAEDKDTSKIAEIAIDDFSFEAHNITFEKLYGSYYKINFNYSELYNIPMDYFDKDKDRITFCIKPADEQGKSFGASAYAVLHYTKTDGIIKFYTDYEYISGGQQ